MDSTFDLQRPRSKAEAGIALRTPGALAIGGGTDLVPNLRRGLHAPTCLVDLCAVEGLDRIGRRADGGWTIGAAVTLATIEADPAIAAALPALAQAAASVAGPAHRNAATLAGNLCQDTRCIYYNQSAWWRAANGGCLKRDGSVCHVAPQGQRCHAAYAGDIAPALLVHDAEVEVTSADAGTRRVALAALYRDDGAAHLDLAAGEWIAAVHLPSPPPGSRSGYLKMRQRAAMDFALAGVAMRLRVDGGRIAELAVAVSGTHSMPLRVAGTDALVGRAVDDEALAQLGKLVARQVSPMRSTVTAANHRRLVAVVAAQRLLRGLAG